jgi:hypothetical protein
MLSHSIRPGRKTGDPALFATSVTGKMLLSSLQPSSSFAFPMARGAEPIPRPCPLPGETGGMRSLAMRTGRRPKGSSNRRALARGGGRSPAPHAPRPAEKDGVCGGRGLLSSPNLPPNQNEHVIGTIRERAKKGWLPSSTGLAGCHLGHLSRGFCDGAIRVMGVAPETGALDRLHGFFYLLPGHTFACVLPCRHSFHRITICGLEIYT